MFVIFQGVPVPPLTSESAYNCQPAAFQTCNCYM